IIGIEPALTRVCRRGLAAKTEDPSAALQIAQRPGLLPVVFSCRQRSPSRPRPGAGPTAASSARAATSARSRLKSLPTHKGCKPSDKALFDLIRPRRIAHLEIRNHHPVIRSLGWDGPDRHGLKLVVRPELIDSQ